MIEQGWLSSRLNEKGRWFSKKYFIPVKIANEHIHFWKLYVQRDDDIRQKQEEFNSRYSFDFTSNDKFKILWLK